MSWQDSYLACSGTHHLIDGEPLYADRYDEVLKFHAPGLAPVRRGGSAWHIRPDGAPAYDRRFRRTFGFYEGLAAVEGEGGWHHIHPDGTDLYTARYEWCGNFQGGRCPVREQGGTYLHITTTGEPAYEVRWRYAGDFRDGVGVVQGEAGRSTHISPVGELIHGKWFLDLDVYHKGYARARDEAGWTHIDRAGRPAYSRRFAAVEPFYNGQARVERLDGGLEAIDETGRTVTELRPSLRSEFAELSSDMVGFWRTQAICTAVELGVFEALPDTVEGVAGSCGLESDRVRRLLRGLAELRLTSQDGDKWSTTARGEYLRAEHPWSLAGAAVEYGRHFPRLWEELPAALQTASGWQAPDIFAEVARDPERARKHHQMLRSYALHDYAAVPAALDLRGEERVLDAGGGLGALAGLLVEEYPGLHVVVLDRPEVVEQSRQKLKELQDQLAALEKHLAELG